MAKLGTITVNIKISPRQAKLLFKENERLKAEIEGLRNALRIAQQYVDGDASIQVFEMAVEDLALPDQTETDWKLKAMQIIDKVANDEGIWFEPWPGVTEEEQKEIKRDYKTYKLNERPMWPECEMHNFP